MIYVHNSVQDYKQILGNSLDAQVNVFLDTETKVPVLREILSPQLILFHLEASLQDLLGLSKIQF